MKMRYLIVFLFIFVSCSVQKSSTSNPSIFIVNKGMREDDTITVYFKNNSRKSIFLALNENPNYFENFVFINSQNLVSFLQLTIEDENGNNKFDPKSDKIGFIKDIAAGAVMFAATAAIAVLLLIYVPKFQ